MDPRLMLPHVRTLPASAAILTLLFVFSLVGRPALAVQPTGPAPSLGVLPFAGDVFTLGSNGSLIAVDPSATPASAPLFNLGGGPLNLTWGAFSTATATASALETGTHDPDTTVRMHFSGLIPHGVYSVFYRTFAPDSNNPLCPNVEPSLALTSIHLDQLPDRASFVADAQGAADFTGIVDSHLLDAQQVQYSIIYHFDGHTYGDLANLGEASTQGANCRSSYGIDAMRQFLVIQK